MRRITFLCIMVCVMCMLFTLTSFANVGKELTAPTITTTLVESVGEVSQDREYIVHPLFGKWDPSHCGTPPQPRPLTKFMDKLEEYSIEVENQNSMEQLEKAYMESLVPATVQIEVDDIPILNMSQLTSATYTK